MTAISASYHLYARPDTKQQVLAFFTTVLGLDVVVRSVAGGSPNPIYVFTFANNAHLSVEFTEDALSDEQALRGAWLELRADNAAELQQKMQAFGLKRIVHPSTPYFYIQAPGGQVFRIVENEEGPSTSPERPLQHIEREIIIPAAPEQVFHALTQPDGLTGWWANQAIAAPIRGTVIELHFDNDETMQMEIADLEVGKKVHWLVQIAPHDWEGSTITWDLQPVSAGTQLLFCHHDLVEGKSGYGIAQTRAGWDYFLQSLQRYLETGKGTPYRYKGGEE
jgi:uncharacterized protein YndB with AHSA1/START domain